MTLDLVTLEEVRAAWNEFNSLEVPHCGDGGRGGSLPGVYKARDAAFKVYAKLRDHYMYQRKAISITQLNEKWYPRVNGYLQSNLQ